MCICFCSGIVAVIVLCLFRQEVGFDCRFTIFIAFQNCISFLQKPSKRIDDTCCISTVNHLKSWVTIFIRRDVNEITGTDQSSKDCRIKQDIRIIHVIDLHHIEVVISEPSELKTIRQTINSLCTPPTGGNKLLP